LELSDARELHALIVNDTIHRLLDGSDQFFKAANVVACGERRNQAWEPQARSSF
jgi:hypothetical protein